MARLRISRSAGALLLLGLFAVSACRDTGGAEDAFFEVGGKLFVFNYRVATARYLVNLNPLRPIEAGQTAVARFEDPAGGDDIEVRQAIWPKLSKTTIESPPVRCVVKDRPYKVSIRIEGPEGKLLQSIETTITSSENQDLLPDRPLVVGPFYTSNPDLAGRPDGKLPGEDQATCPAAT
ncbi:hypothetical protein ABUE31_05795 [Mesorhizobium sp. ZMM04-5]|uniref:Lipoprotein n=1 Tax=Mesorhizobium marinum TaxID=3228790 RepID=A0ABV3QWQ3_9HYPH